MSVISVLASYGILLMYFHTNEVSRPDIDRSRLEFLRILSDDDLVESCVRMYHNYPKSVAGLAISELVQESSRIRAIIEG
jgi:hypothetical protein